MFGDFSFNLVGTCTRDREITKLANGQDRAVLVIAVNRPFKDRDTGEFKDKTTWVRVAVFGDRALSAGIDRCRRGMPVYVRGVVESYTEQVGQRAYTMHNFRPDVIRPLMTLEQLDHARSIRRDGARTKPREATDMPQPGPPEDDDEMFED